jgi:hypothetical protein
MFRKVKQNKIRRKSYAKRETNFMILLQFSQSVRFSEDRPMKRGKEGSMSLY